jgi:hypothetical protein
MHLKMKAFGLFAALAMCLGLVGPVSAANTTPVVITLNDVGTFSLDFGGTVFFPSPTGPITCNPTSGFAPGSVSAASGTTITGSICLVYTDTQTYRDTFHVDLSATNFDSTKAVPVPGTGVYSIPMPPCR